MDKLYVTLLLYEIDCEINLRIYKINNCCETIYLWLFLRCKFNFRDAHFEINIYEVRVLESR